MDFLETEAVAQRSAFRRERWYRSRMPYIWVLSWAAAVLDVASGAYWVWGLNALALCFCVLARKEQGFLSIQMVERTAISGGALLTSLIGGFQTAAGITRLTTDYEGFLYCAKDSYDCYTVTGCISLVAAAVWWVVAALYIHAMARIYRVSLWTRWNPSAPILFLTFLASALEIIGFGYTGWIFNAGCLLVQLQSKHGLSPTSFAFGLAALLAILSSFLQGGVALQQMFRDEQHNYICDHLHLKLHHFNCSEDMQAVCLSGACVWFLVFLLCTRLSCKLAEETDETTDADGTSSMNAGMLEYGFVSSTDANFQNPVSEFEN